MKLLFECHFSLNLKSLKIGRLQLKIGDKYVVVGHKNLTPVLSEGWNHRAKPVVVQVKSLKIGDNSTTTEDGIAV